MLQQIAVKPAQAYAANQSAAPQKIQSKDTKDTFKSIMKSAAKKAGKKASAVKGGSPKTAKTEKEEPKEQGAASGAQNEPVQQQSPDSAQAASAVSGQAQAVQNTAADGAETVSAIAIKAGDSVQVVSASSTAAAVQAAGKPASKETGADVKSAAQTVPQVQTEQIKNTKNIQPEVPQQAKAGENQTALNSGTAQVVTKETQAAQTAPDEAKPISAKAQKAVTVNPQPVAQDKKNSSAAEQKVKTGFQSAEQVKAAQESPNTAGAEKKPQSVPVKADSLPEKSDSSPTVMTAQSAANLYGGGNVVVKVSDTAAKTETSASRQVADTVSYQLKNGKQEFQMNLFPQSLGKVSVKLTTENGILTVEIAASNPKTQSLLIANSGDIKSLLQTSTGQQVQVVKQEQASQWYGQQQGGGYGGQQGQQQEGQQQDNANQNRQVIFYGGNDSNLNTGDFLSMMRQLSANAQWLN